MPGVFAEGELLDRDHREHFAGGSSADDQDLRRRPPIAVACREAICSGQAQAFSEEWGYGDAEKRERRERGGERDRREREI